MNKIIRLLMSTQQLELELDDWKRTYWMLEKKVNQMELNEENPINSKSSQIEIEFDFKKNQLVQYEDLKNQLKIEREKCIQLQDEI